MIFPSIVDKMCYQFLPSELLLSVMFAASLSITLIWRVYCKIQMRTSYFSTSIKEVFSGSVKDYTGSMIKTSFLMPLHIDYTSILELTVFLVILLTCFVLVIAYYLVYLEYLESGLELKIILKYYFSIIIIAMSGLLIMHIIVFLNLNIWK